MKTSDKSRRLFIGSSLALGAGALLYFNKTKPKKILMFKNQVQILLHSSYYLFPHSKLGPGAIDLSISSYLAQVLKDERILEEDRGYFLKGATWLEESAYEEYNKSFLNLNNSEKEELLQTVSKYKWGKNFIYTSLSYIFEALLSSPVYGSNKDGLGWKWLEHSAGFPQPKSRDEIYYEV